MDDGCFAAIEAKCNASGTREFARLERRCSEVLTVAFRNYQQQLRTKSLTMPSSSKEWWKVSRELLNRKSKASTIPSLKDATGKWILDPVEKASLLAQTFQSKCVLPPQPDTVEEIRAHTPMMPEFCLMRTRWALSVIKQLKHGKASGPDGLLVRVFKECGLY